MQLAAASINGRSYLADVRCEGLVRLGGPFARADGGITVVTQKLGPGVLRGDNFETGGSVAANAHLCVRAQSASRAFGGGAMSSNVATWRVECDGFLQLIAEPLVAFDDARHTRLTTVSLAPGAACLALDLVTRLTEAARIDVRMRIADDECLLAYDAAELHGPIDPQYSCVGTLLLCGAIPAERLIELCDAVEAAPGVRVGVGRPVRGGVFVRVAGSGAWNVQQTLLRYRARLLPALGRADDPR